MSTDLQEELTDLFVMYLSESVQMLNSIKGSLYDILNISLKPADTTIQPTMPSISASCKKTLDDLKRISSILRGYSKSKNLQRDDESIRKSRYESLNNSRSNFSTHLSSSSKSRAKIAKIANDRLRKNPDKHSQSQRLSEEESEDQKALGLVTNLNHKKDQLKVRLATEGNAKSSQDAKYTPVSRLKNYKSVSNLNKDVELMDLSRLAAKDESIKIIDHSQSGYHKGDSSSIKGNRKSSTDKAVGLKLLQEQSLAKRPKDQINEHPIFEEIVKVDGSCSIASKPQQQLAPRTAGETEQNQVERNSGNEFSHETESRFYECMVRNESGISDIIRRNQECISLLKDIHSDLESKSAKRQRKRRSNYHQETAVR